MDTCSSGEDLILKTRKPYTITKQREKWTEEEHSRFLEALKLYGRAWQRIEEHIGTKTAVQIRSHAQKFFSKLEKEALIKGIPLGQAHGIEIPPPRPKRKPNNPYPRKTSACVSSSRKGKQDRRSASSPVCSEKNLLDMEIDGSHETLGRPKAGSDDSKCSVVLSLFQDAPCASISSASKHPAAGVFREFVPPGKETKTKVGYSEQHPPPVVRGRGVRDGTDLDIGGFEGLSIDTQIKLAQERSMWPSQPPNLCASPRKGLQGSKRHPDHAPVYSVRGEKNKPGSYATTLTSLSNLAGAHANAGGSPAPAISGTTEHHGSTSISSVHQPFAAFPPFAQFGKDAPNMSSAFSSLIVSTLVQNPAVHAAATVAASFWPTADAEASTGSASESFVGGIPMRQMNPSPSMAAIAAATVAAASAWWATHGLLPFCPPPAAFHGGFAFAPAPTSAIPRTKTAHAAKDDTQRKEDATPSQPWSGPRPVDLRSPAPDKQLSPLSSSDSEENGEAGSSPITELKSPAVVVNQLNPAPDSREVRESDIGRSKKKADRSSCGSNTPSSSDVETDVVLNLEKAILLPAKETHLCHPPSGGDASNRRLRGGGSVGESWKEVSQEGRLAFQALFSREVLPQSFSPPHPKEGVPDKPKGDAADVTVDLNSKVCAATGDDLAHVLGRSYPVPRGGSTTEEALLTDEIGQGRLKSRRTGFKPYKRCSMEAKDSRATPVEKKDNKRIRLEGEAST
ncbi:unnamed protein product [Spirodela intermedia]|uniref:Uncharacterized protein n=2 Tax=Spirodela intermedia TaxID=51605 RepID=A0A7I8IE89_SPIIN|nr:unnamed protein product [Spirodela intermedia]CAA6656107.1 unnamed protein product [Spirodela intermedia]CAA7391552.1 unnamed protein product [Spirodela intermedia]